MSQENNDTTEEKVSPKKMGRPSTFTQQIGDIICERIAHGETLRTIIRDENMPEQRQVYKWLEIHEDFRQQYAHARARQADYYAEQIIDEAFSSHDAQIGRLRMEALKWVASKLAPKKYGDKVEVETKGDANLQISFAIPERKMPIQLEENKRIEDAE